MTKSNFIMIILREKEAKMLELFYSDTCPYCKKVIDFFESNNVKFIPKEIHQSPNYDELMTIGKIAQVPFLVDKENNVSMYESGDIIEYVKNLNK